MPTNKESLANIVDEMLPVWERWTPGGRRIMLCRVRRVRRAQCVVGCVKNQSAELSNGIYYELLGDQPLPFSVLFYDADNYKDMVIDNEEAGIGICRIEENERGSEESVQLKLYLDRNSFAELREILGVSHQATSLWLHASLRKITKSPSGDKILVTRYELRNVLDFVI